MIDRFGKRRVLRALTKRKFRNKRRAEERKTGQKNMGFKKGGKVEEGLLIMIEEKKRGGKVRNKRQQQALDRMQRAGAAAGGPGAKGKSDSNREKTEWEKKQELRKKPHSLSLSGITNLAKLRGSQSSKLYSEAFEIVRKIEE